MRIYFTGEIGEKVSAETLLGIHDHLENYGTVLSEELNILQTGVDRLPWLKPRTLGRLEHAEKFIDEADIIVAEVSVPSAFVVYDLIRAEGLGKRILRLLQTEEGTILYDLYYGKRGSPLEVYTTPEEAIQNIDEFFEGFKA